MAELRGLTEEELAAIKVGAPYDGQGSALALDKHVHYPQLAAELRAVLPDEVSFVAQGDLTGEEGFLTIHFSDPDVDPSRVQAVVESHEINLDHGMSEDLLAFNALKAKLDKTDLTLKELNALLRLHFSALQ